MKLEDIYIAASSLTDTIYIGTRNKRSPGAWSSKTDCTSTFIGTLMAWVPPGSIRTVVDNQGNEYEIEVRKVEANGGSND